MAVDPLNPSRPTLLDESIELTEELRAIKRRLVADKEDLDQLKNTFAGINSLTPYMADMLAKNNANEALAHLMFTATGIEISRMANYANLATALGVANPTPQVSVGPSKWCIQFPGGFKINIISASIPDQGLVTWQTSFSQSVYGAVVSLNVDDNRSTHVYNINNSGANVSFSGSGTLQCTVIAMGF